MLRPAPLAGFRQTEPGAAEDLTGQMISLRPRTYGAMLETVDEGTRW